MKLSRNFEVGERDDGSVLFRLPRNKGWRARKLGLLLVVPMFMCGGFGGGICFFFAAVVKNVPFFVYLFPIPFLLLAAFLAICIAWLLFGHITIQLNFDYIRRTFWLGPLPLLTSKCPVESVQRLSVVNWPEENTNDLVASRLPHSPSTLVWKYPKDVVAELAGELVGRLQLLTGRKDVGWDYESMAFTGERLVQPAGSRVRLEDTDTGFIFKIPRQGLLGPALFLFPFGLFFMAPGAVAIYHLVTDPKADPMLGVFLIPPAIGICIWWVALHLAYRRMELEVRDGDLNLRRIGLHRVREQVWPWGEVAAVAAVREQRRGRTQHGGSYSFWAHLVRIFSADGSTHDLEGRYGMNVRTVPAEWEWIATTLRGGLGVPAWPE
jgi:hypothetical protein